MPNLRKISPCLWFDDQAEAAATFYVGVFPNSRITAIARYGEVGREIHGRPAGSVMTVAFELDGQSFTALNGGPVFKFNEAVSFQVDCKTQNEVDYFWEKLSAGGPCGLRSTRHRSIILTPPPPGVLAALPSLTWVGRGVVVAGADVGAEVSDHLTAHRAGDGPAGGLARAAAAASVAAAARGGRGAAAGGSGLGAAALLAPGRLVRSWVRSAFALHRGPLYGRQPAGKARAEK